MIGFFGGMGTRGGSSAQDIAVFQSLTRGSALADRVKQFAKSGEVEREVQYFRENISKVKSPEEFFKNRRLHAFALSAYDMEEELNYPARSKQVMMSDLNDRMSLANRMTAVGHREMALSFEFYKERNANEKPEALELRQVAKLRDTAFVERVVSKYVQSEFEQQYRSNSPSVSDALYFKRKIASVTSTYQLIGDGVLLGVAMDGMGIPRALAGQSTEKLKEALDKGFDLARAKKEPEYLDRFLNRFIVMRDLQSMQNTRNPLLGVFE